MEEAKYFSQGRYVETTPICPPFTAALLLCADLWNPALVHLAAVNGATALIVPTNSSNDRSSGDFTKPAKWDLALRFYAMMYGLPIIFANRVGTEEGHEFWGGSRIVDARGEVIAKAEGDAEQLVIAELDYDQVRRARYELPTVRDSNLELLHREVNRLTSRVGVPDRFRHDKG
jgi:predicted amidohydrolase